MLSPVNPPNLLPTRSALLKELMHRKLGRALALSTLILITACASRPESIPASFVSHEKFMGKDCAQLGLDMSNARSELAKYSSMQDSKANMDAATVFLVLIPASKLSGDHAGDVAKYKGEVEAIDTALVKTRCNQP